MHLAPNNRLRSGLPGWSAPAMGVVVGAMLCFYQLVVEHKGFEPVYLLLFCAIGLFAGLVVWTMDALRKRNRQKCSSDQIPERLHALPDAIEPARFFVEYKSSFLSPLSAPRDSLAKMLQHLGAGLFALFVASLLLGRLVVAIFVPEFSKGELTDEKLVWLIPIWSLGILAMVLWAMGTGIYYFRRANVGE